MKKPNETTVTNNITVTRAKYFPAKDGKPDATVFDMTVNGVSIYNCRIVAGKIGDFVAFPNTKGSDGKYYNIAYVKLTPEDTTSIIKMVENIICPQ